MNFIVQLSDLLHFPALAFPLQDAPIESLRLMGMKLVNPTDFWALVFRYAFNLLVTFILVRVIYYASNKRKEYFFIYFLMNTVVFLLCFMLENIELQLGFALGLFALFGIIRYRTDPIPIKEMTYLFVVVGVGIINALANSKISYAELVLANTSILLITWYLEKIWMVKQLEKVLINYEKIELIHAAKREELIQDLRERTGLDVREVSVVRMSYLRDTARLMVSYKPKS